MPAPPRAVAIARESGAEAAPPQRQADNLAPSEVGTISGVRYRTATMGAKGRLRTMPRYYLNPQEGGVLVKDPEGCELPDLEAAETLATHSAREMIQNSVRTRGTVNLTSAIVITDDSGGTVSTINFGDAVSIVTG